MTVFRSIVVRAGALVALSSAPVVVASEASGFPIVTSYSAYEIGIDGWSFTVIQDADGIVRVGARGLASFDGKEWTVSPINNSYALRGLDLGSDGQIWAGALGEIGWFIRTPEGMKYHSLIPSLAAEHRDFGEIFQVFSDGKGAVFVSAEKILRWDGAKFHVWSYLGTRRLRASRADGTIFVQHKPTGLIALREAGLEVFVPSAKLGNAGVFWVERRGTGWLLVTHEGLWEWSSGELHAIAPETSALIGRSSLTCVVDLRDGRLALGTGSGGILIINRDGGLVQRIGEGEGLPTQNVFSLFVDRDAQLWGTSAAHVFRVNLNSASTILARQSNLPEGPTRHIEVVGDRVLALIDTSLHELKFDRQHFESRSEVDGYPRVMRGTPQGLVLGTIRDIRRLDNGGSTSIYSNGRDIFAIEPSHRGKDYLLFSERTEVRMVAPDGTVQILGRDLPDIAESIAEEKDGRLWLGTSSHGVIQVAPDGTVSRNPLPDSAGPLNLNRPITTLATDEGDIFVLAATGGWVKPRGAAVFESISKFPLRETVATSPTRHRSNVWIVLAKTESRPPMIGQVAFEGDHAVWQPHAVDGIESIGSPRSIFAEKLADQSTVLWIGGTKGILRNVVSAGPFAPAPKAPAFHVFARKSDASAPSLVTDALPYSTGSVEFRFSAPQFAVLPTLRLESRIEGIDDDWVPAGASSRRELTALRDGRYTIHARTVADTGVASEVTSFAFAVSPPWWRTWTAVVGLVVALAPIAFASYRLRVRALQRRNVALEEKVRQRTRQLEAASAAKTQFVANMSHDIRNPLNGIVGLALALEDTRLEPRQREIVATLRECTTYLSTLVDDVLDFASIEAGRVELRPGAFAPAQLLRSVVETLRADAADRGASVVVEIGAGLPPNLVGDAGRIQQILVNFVSNALKYGGGEVRLSVSLPSNAPGEIEFSVRDRGPGIRPEDRGKLFEKFSRLARPDGDTTMGTGLGLAASRQLADIMGGAVGVESEVGSGSRFFLRLPLVVASAPADVAALDLPNTTVLLVEDTDYNAWAATAVLARLGLACERARTGAEAVRMFAEKRFNIVLLDRNLPDMDGTEVARQMREIEAEGQPAILLAVTAYCTAADRDLCLHAGMDAFVGKPLTPEKLRQVFVTAGRRMLAAASVPVPREFSPAQVDTALLSYLSDGSAEGFDDQIQRFIVTLRAAEQELAEASLASDFSLLRAGAHRLLGQAKMIGGAALAEAAQRLEAAAQCGDGSACREWLDRVRREIDVVTESMCHQRSAAQPG